MAARGVWWLGHDACKCSDGFAAPRQASMFNVRFKTPRPLWWHDTCEGVLGKKVVKNTMPSAASKNLPGSKEHRRRLKPPSLRGPPVIGAGCHGRNALHFTICGWHQPARRAEPARGQMLTMSFPQRRTRHLDNARAAFRQSVRGKGGQVVWGWPLAGGQPSD